MNELVDPEILQALRELDTCSVANAIETLNVRLRNEGFADSRVRCQFPQFDSMLGFAATVRIRCSAPPPDGHAYIDRTDWWNHILTVPAPRVVVIQDVDRYAGLGAFLGEVHVNVLRALGCVGAVTNGSVRDLQAVEKTGFHLFAHHAAVSHAYVHIVDFGKPVEIGGLQISPGDLLHGDRHGVLSVPKEAAKSIPEIARRQAGQERRVIDFCQSPQFSVEHLREAVRGIF